MFGDITRHAISPQGEIPIHRLDLLVELLWRSADDAMRRREKLVKRLSDPCADDFHALEWHTRSAMEGAAERKVLKGVARVYAAGMKAEEHPDAIIEAIMDRLLTELYARACDVPSSTSPDANRLNNLYRAAVAKIAGMVSSCMAKDAR